MEFLAGARIALTPRPVQRREAALEVAMLGHCPGRVRLERLLLLTGTVADMTAVGYGDQVNKILLASAVRKISGGGTKEKPWDKYVDTNFPVRDMDRQSMIEALGVFLAGEVGDVSLLAKAVDELLLLKALDEILAGNLLDSLLQDKTIEKSALVDAIVKQLPAHQADPALVDSAADALLTTEASDKPALIRSAAEAVNRLLWGHSWELYHLPIPLHSSAEFHDIFPDAATADTSYVSLLAGKRAWLARAVDDFFANGGEKLWVVRIPEILDQSGKGQQEFLPAADTRMHDPETLRGLATVLVIPALAVVALPDLERLQVPPNMPDVPRVRLENPDPRFLPCGAANDDDHRERRYPSEMTGMPEPLAVEELLAGILPFIARHRPDVQCLLTLPLAYSGEIDCPAADRKSIDRIAEIRDGGDGHLLRHVQLLFPYLRGPRFALSSAVGLIAGKQAAMARARGPWYSIGAQPLLSEGLPYPRLSMAQILALRDKPGVGVLNVRSGFAGRNQLSLDDERLAVPALPPSDYAEAVDRRAFDGFRAAEIMRFLGFLRRQLQALGEQLVFNLDTDDPRPRLLLERFFRRLYNLGALRGALPEEAYQISETQPREGAIQFDIQVAPAFPIDRLFLTFINLNGEWRTEVNGG